MKKPVIPTIKWNDEKSEATITIPYAIRDTYTDDVVFLLVEDLVEDFLTDRPPGDEQFH